MDFIKRLGLTSNMSGVYSGNKTLSGSGELLESSSPTNGSLIGVVKGANEAEYDQVVEQAQKAFTEWRTWPAPKRGEVVRQLGEALRNAKEDLGALVSYEMGKSLQEGLGEVQEMIDICDFAVGVI